MKDNEISQLQRDVDSLAATVVKNNHYQAQRRKRTQRTQRTQHTQHTQHQHPIDMPRPRYIAYERYGDPSGQQWHGGRSRTSASASASATYTVVRSSVGAPGGRYVSKSGPAAAARKAASKRFGSGTSMRVTIRETSSDHEFTYDATRVKLPKPVVRTIAGVTVTSRHRVDVVKSSKSVGQK